MCKCFKKKKKKTIPSDNDEIRELQKQIARLERIIKEEKQSQTGAWFARYGLWLGILIIIAGFIFASTISWIYISNESLVLGFVGVLATFVVISNYSELRDIRNDNSAASRKINFEFKDAMNGLKEKQTQMEREFKENIQILDKDFDEKIKDNLKRINIASIQNELYNNLTSGTIARGSKQYISALNLFFDSLEKSISLFNEKELEEDMRTNAGVLVDYIYEIIKDEGSNIDISDSSVLIRYMTLMMTSEVEDGAQVEFVLDYFSEKMQEVENN